MTNQEKGLGMDEGTVVKALVIEFCILLMSFINSCV